MSVFRTTGVRWRRPGRRLAAVAACVLAGAGLTGGGLLAAAGPAAATRACQLFGDSRGQHHYRLAVVQRQRPGPDRYRQAQHRHRPGLQPVLGADLTS